MKESAYSKKLFIEELKDLYSAENELIQALPKLEKPTTDPDLIAAFEEHLKLTQRHISHLEGMMLIQFSGDAGCEETLRFQITEEVARLKTSMRGFASSR